MFIGVIRAMDTKEVLSHTIFPSDVTEEFVKRKVDEFNNSGYKSRYAEYVTVDDNSLIAFLAKKANEPLEFVNGTIQEALNAIGKAETAINEAEMAIRGLRVHTDKENDE